MKVSWRNAGENPGTFEHYRIFIAGEKDEDGRSPHAFMVHLIRETRAVELALNDRIIWNTSKYGIMTTEELVARAIMGEPRQAGILVLIDYNIEDDWIDRECRACGSMYGLHIDCPTLSSIDKKWIDVVRITDGH